MEHSNFQLVFPFKYIYIWWSVKFPVGTKLFSAIYAISVKKSLLKPLTLELQHCVALETKDQADSLKFVRAPLVGSNSNAKFTIMEGGEFTPGGWDCSISCYHFCQVGIVQPTGIFDSFIWSLIWSQYIASNNNTYFCKVYYEKISALEWSVKLCIMRCPKALEEIYEVYPGAVDYCSDEVLPSGNSSKFVLDNDPP